MSRQEYSTLRQKWRDIIATLETEDLAPPYRHPVLSDTVISRLRDAYHRILKDVVRTDRQHPFFATTQGEGSTAFSGASQSASLKSEVDQHPRLQSLLNVLMTFAYRVTLQHEQVYRAYTIRNPDRKEEANDGCGYVQGMSDIASTLLIGLDGDEAMTFTLFSGLMKDGVGANFESDGRGMRHHLVTMGWLLRVLVPTVYKHLQSLDPRPLRGQRTESAEARLNEPPPMFSTPVPAERQRHPPTLPLHTSSLFGFFRWFLVLFKREFDVDDVLRLWEVAFAWDPTLSTPDSTTPPLVWHIGSTRGIGYLLFVAVAFVEHISSALLDTDGLDAFIQVCNDPPPVTMSDLLARTEHLYTRFRDLVVTHIGHRVRLDSGPVDVAGIAKLLYERHHASAS